MAGQRRWATYTGQVEQDAAGQLWAVLYRDDDCRPGTELRREPVMSLRAGRRRVEQLVLAAADDDLELAGATDRNRNHCWSTDDRLPSPTDRRHAGAQPLV